MELGYLSLIFLREKKENKHRLILKLKELNKFVPRHHFKMGTLKSALNMTRKGCFMTSIDLTGAYYSVPIETSLLNFFVFQFQRKFYRYTCLPNGLISAPRIFAKIMKTVLSTLKKLGYNVMNYLDNIFICGYTFAKCRDSVLATVNILLKLGFSIHTEKSQPIPVQKIEYLVFLIDFAKMKISLTKIKQDQLKNLIVEVSNSSKIRIRDISKVLVSSEAVLPAINNWRLYMFYLQKLKNGSLKLCKGNFDTFLKLTSTTKVELCWWDKHLACSQDIFTESPELTIFSDACPTGWGAACKGNSTGQNWTPEESCFHINTLEVVAALYAVKIYTEMYPTVIFN